jgi:ketosteroid isomerase-like protein
MKKVIMTCITSLLFIGTMAASDTPADVKKINDLEAALGVAMIHKDVATLSNIVGDDWTIQSDSGVTGTKAGFIDDVKSGRLVITSFKLHDLHVRVIGDVAFVQGADDEVSSYDGKNSAGTYNWLDVWQKRDGHWVSIATQLTRVKTKE